MRTSQQATLLSGNALKLIAVIAMIVDHVGWAFLNTNSIEGSISHTIGRLTAPIMFFFIAEGYSKTSNVRKYATRLAIFAFISHIPFNWFTNSINGYNGVTTLLSTSVIFTLLVGLIMLILWDKFPIWQYRLVTVVGAVALTGYSDWPFFGVLMILCFHVYRSKPLLMWVSYFTVNAVLIATQFLDPATVNAYTVTPMVIGPILICLILSSYNGQRGKGGVFAKWGFYVLYPLHLLIITAILNYLIN